MLMQSSTRPFLKQHCVFACTVQQSVIACVLWNIEVMLQLMHALIHATHKHKNALLAILCVPISMGCWSCLHTWSCDMQQCQAAYALGWSADCLILSLCQVHTKR